MYQLMSNVDAVRLLADEHHLEFVDLDRFNVDASVSSVIPVAVARRHHVVPIGRKFGAPVVAMSNPADVMAMDVLRAVIGREFVAVVAIEEQINSCLARVYGDAPDSGSGHPASTLSDSTASRTASNGHAPVIDRDGPRSIPPTPRAMPSPLPPGVVPPPPPAAPAVPAESPLSGYVPPTPTAQTPPPPAAPRSAPATEPQRAEDVLAAALEVIDSKLGDAPPAAPGGPEGAGTDTATIEPTSGGPGERSAATTESEAPRVERVEDVVAAADLVEEVVGEYEQSGEAPDAGDVPAGMEGFPPLARVLIEGGRVSLADMESVLQEHNRSGQTIARILTARGLVTEADLMWGMAKEMGLEFVDLDGREHQLQRRLSPPRGDSPSPQRARDRHAGQHPRRGGVESDRRLRDGRPADDHRAQLHHRRGTRSQINAYIEKAYHQGGDASEVANTAAAEYDDLRGRTRRPPVGRRRRPDRQVREPPHPPVAERAGLGHPRRADCATTCGSGTGSTAFSTTCPPHPGRSLRRWSPV